MRPGCKDACVGPAEAATQRARLPAPTLTTALPARRLALRPGREGAGPRAFPPGARIQNGLADSRPTARSKDVPSAKTRIGAAPKAQEERR